MATAEMILHLPELPEVRTLVDACIVLVQARNSGADVYEAGSEVEAIEQALKGLGITIGGRETIEDFNKVTRSGAPQ